jgi:hypothetical protein
VDVALTGAAAFGVMNAVPSTDSGMWPAQLAAAKAELDARSTKVAALETGFSRSGASPTALRDHDEARFQIVFGAGFPVACCLTAAFAQTLPSVFASSAGLLGTKPLEPITWLTRSARVRAGAARLAECMMYAEALNSSAPWTPVVAQLPVVTADVWAGLPFPTGVSPKDRLSLVTVVRCTARRPR